MSSERSGKRRAAPARKRGATGGSFADRRAARKAERKARPRPVGTKARVVWFAKWALLLGLVGVLVVVGGLVLVYVKTDIPDPNKDFLTQTSTVYYNDGKDPIGRFAIQNRQVIKLSEMPSVLKDAVIAAENRSFYDDKGIDPKGVIRALFNNASGGSTQGGSTITQQYVKILYLSQERSYTRKLKEAVLALKLQREKSKDEILEGYLNTIYFGRGAYGVQAAAEAYFQVPARKLNLRQAAVLASVLNSPTALDPANGKDARTRLKERYDYVLSAMAEDGSITTASADKFEGRLPKFPRQEAESTYGDQKGHMLELVKDELEDLGFKDEQIEGGGYQVTTTFTQKAMDAAEEGVVEGRPDGFSDRRLHIAVASVEPGTGALRGFYAGQDYLRSQINWAVAGGMVGSTFKPFTLATALSNGYSLRDTFDGNSPYTFPDGLEVKNEGGGSGESYGSSVTATYALEQSINTAFVDMSNSIPDGPDKILTTAEKLGVPPRKPNRRYPGIPASTVDLEPDSLITLGKARISPINMANAYATIANGGMRANVHVVDKVVDPDGNVVYQYEGTSPQRAISADVAADTSYAMQQVVASGTGRAALALDRPAAGKTGTATNNKDQASSAWFAGFTPQLATAVMYVRGDGDDQLDGYLPSYFGADFPAETWTDVMRRDMVDEPVEEFPDPAYVDGDAPQTGHTPVYIPTTQPTRRPTRHPTAGTSPSSKPMM